MSFTNVVCITGIDTGIGKTIATGVLAKSLAARGHRVITAKAVQTGCQGESEDILMHRQMMGVEVYPEDIDLTTCPYIFTHPCSPHLAARMDGRSVDLEHISAAVTRLSRSYDLVLLEGAGGISVPLTEDLLFVDLLEAWKIPVVLVSSCRLGSINHTFLSLEVLYQRKIEVLGIVYNLHGEADPLILADSRELFAKKLKSYGYPPLVLDLPDGMATIAGDLPEVDYSSLFEAISIL